MDCKINLEQMRGDGFLKNLLDDEKNRIQKINDTMGWSDIHSCPVCSSKKNKFLLNYNDNPKLKLVKCLGCELVYFLSRPANLSAMYEDESYLVGHKNTYLNNVDYRMTRFAAERIEIIKSQTQNIANCSLLDVGCGTGWFLEEAKKSGFTVSGQELSKPLAKFASDRLGIKVYCESLDNIRTKFHFITAFDVLEHVPNPVQFVNQLKDLLLKNGRILLFTPNVDSFAIGVGRARSNLIVPSLHLTFFNKVSIYKLAEITQSKVTYFGTHGLDIGDMKALSDWNDLASISTEKWQILADTLQPHIDALELGNHLRTIFKKI